MTIKEETYNYPDNFIILAKVGTGEFGDVELVKSRMNN